MLEQITYTTTTSGSNAFATFIAVLLFLLWIVMIGLFIDMTMNVRKMRRIMEHDRGSPAPRRDVGPPSRT